MQAQTNEAPLEPVVKAMGHGEAAMQEWFLPLDTAYLRELLSHIFSRYWDQVVFGALVPGAAYEMMCPREPSEISYSDGYLTVSFGGPHFHLCLGEARGDPANPPPPPEFNKKRMPSRATIFRQLDAAGAPVSWGFDMKNGDGEPMITIFFANPFVTNAEILEREAHWDRLAMWRDLSLKYLGRPPEAFDESGLGYTQRAA